MEERFKEQNPILNWSFLGHRIHLSKYPQSAHYNLLHYNVTVYVFWGDCLCLYKPAALHCNTQHRSQLCPLLFKVASSRNPSGDFGHGIGLETQLPQTDPAKRWGLASRRPYRAQRHRVRGRIRPRHRDLLPGQSWQRGAFLQTPWCSLPSPSSADDISINIFQLQERGGGKKNTTQRKKTFPTISKATEIWGKMSFVVAF